MTMAIYEGSDGAELHYDEVGAGPAVIVLAGGAARHPSYLGDLGGLAERHRLIIPHLRGVGRSHAALDRARPEQASYWRQSEDVEALRVHLGLGRVVVLGHSAGTRLAMSHAIRFPAGLAALVLVTPPSAHLVDAPSDADALFAKRRDEPWYAEAVEAGKNGPATPDDAGINDFYARVAPRSFAHWGPVEQAHATVGETAWAANRAYFSVEPPADFAARLAGVTAPVLVVAGAEDCTTGLAPVVALPELFGDGHLVVIDDCGHFPWVEQPELFRQAVENFLEE
jgi:pimeloyl-ACP methyl ester carboxylesterase